MEAVAIKPDKGLALVVDDSPVQRNVLTHLLLEKGYQVICAKDGKEGVASYIENQPDLVLMDINMPVMNGYEAAKKIKNHSDQYSLCPLIFVTNEDTDSSYIECVEAGGDGILVRPFSPKVFQAKIKSIQRISDLYGQIKKLQQLQDADAQIAEKLMSDVIEARNFGLERIGIIKKPAALFSGDIHLSALCPNGDVNVMLGDFTGHGLRSSIGAVPIAETFRVMTRKGFSLLDIVTQINTQLYQLLPADLFLAAAFVTVSSHEESIYVLNAGLPDAYIFSAFGDIKRKVSSSHPPMGVVANLLLGTEVSIISAQKTDRVILLSDGIIEARNKLGHMYDYLRFEKAVVKGLSKQNIASSVLASIDTFCQGVEQEDDISLVDIPCGGWQQTYPQLLRGDVDIEIDSQADSVWQWQLSLAGKRLATVNPIPLLMNHINEIEGHGEHWLGLQTILTELFTNSLDHGVLALSSSLKVFPDGFAQYYQEREMRLKNLELGFVDISIKYFTLANGGRVKVRMMDSGQGFDIEEIYQNKKSCEDTELQLSGRGIELVKQLAESLEYFDGGRTVEATYVWLQH